MRFRGEHEKAIAIFLLLMVLLIFGCAPRAPKISEIDKIAVLLSLKSGEEEITGEITKLERRQIFGNIRLRKDTSTASKKFWRMPCWRRSSTIF